MQDKNEITFDMVKTAISTTAALGASMIIGGLAGSVMRKARPLIKVVGCIGAVGLGMTVAKPVYGTVTEYVDRIHDGIKDNVRIEHVDNPEQEDGEN